jgi:hypothetical protein
MGPRRLGNSESGIWVYLQTGPERGPRKLGNSESGICGTVSWNLHTWNLGIWKLRRSILESAHMESRNLESMVLPRTHRGALETRKLGNWNLRNSIPESAHLESWKLDVGVPLRTHGGDSETRKLGNSESGIWVSVLQGCPPPPPPPRALGDRSSLPGPSSPPGSTAFRKWTSQDSTTWIPQYGHLETRNA